MDKNSLDYKVFGRDSILHAQPDQLSGPLSKLTKKLKKVITKVVKFPIKNLKKAGKVIKKNRKILKKIGAVVAIGAAAYFGGPMAWAAIKKMGGSTLIKQAATASAKRKLKRQVKKMLTPQQEAAIQVRASTMTPEQIYADPEIQQVSQQIAQYEGLRQSGYNPQAQIYASEGATEIEYQVAKAAPFNAKSLLVPAGILASILMSR